MAEESKKKCIELFASVHAQTKIKAFVKLIKANEQDPAKTITFTDKLKPWNYENKQQGRPKAKWADKMAKLYWAQIQHNLAPGLQNNTFNFNDHTHRDHLLSSAQSNVRG